MRLTKQQLLQIKHRGLREKDIQKQFDLLIHPPNPVILDRIAKIGDGIIQISDSQQERSLKVFETLKDSFSKVSFVPASGLATRMFSLLIRFYHEFNPIAETFNQYINRTKKEGLNTFFVGLNKFPFYENLLKEISSEVGDLQSYSKNHQKLIIVKTLLFSPKFEYSNTPKGLLPFYQYPNFLATPIFEHIREAEETYGNVKSKTRIHFTISKDFFSDFKTHVKKLIKRKLIGLKENNISFSFQDSNTDTISIKEDDHLLVNTDGNLVFRKSGHGALLKNLNALNEDIIFIKNIDNIAPFGNRAIVIKWKKILAVTLVETQKKVHQILNDLENKSKKIDLQKLFKFINTHLNIQLPKSIQKFSEEDQRVYLQNLLNRPIRVCGVVKNEGEIGGSPFWVKNKDGSVTPQIIELSQVNSSNNNYLKMFTQSEFFNPVNIVCSIKDYKGDKFDLHSFSDESQCIITAKTYEGKPIKVLERPGLWNGCMAKWITLFVEVPLETFNPVKTVNDLLKKDM